MTPIPQAQASAFDLALVKRLGLDPEIVSAADFRAGVEVVSGEELGRVSITMTAYLPADELTQMFNDAGASARQAAT